MQKEDGSMPWYPGLAGNAYLTREVGYLLARLGSDNANARKVMAGIKRYLKATLEEGIAACDSEIIGITAVLESKNEEIALE